MYNSLQLANNIKSSAKSKGVSIGELLKSCELSINTMSNLNHGKSIAFDSLAKIADYLGVSVDYLLGRTDTPTGYSNGISNVQTTVNGSQVSGNNNSNINTGNKSDNNSTLDETAEQVLNAFQGMSLADKAKVITLIAELTEKNKTA